nr:protein plastid movement impaired 2 [Quercus suber]
MEAKVQRNDSLSSSSFEKVKNWELHYFTFIAVNYSRTGSSQKRIVFGQRKSLAEGTADKKVATAHVWIEALKASEKEILMKTELAQREIRQVRVEEECEAYKTKRSLSAKRTVEGELQNWRQKRKKNAEAENLQLELHRKSMKGNGNFTPSR